MSLPLHAAHAATVARHGPAVERVVAALASLPNHTAAAEVIEAAFALEAQRAGLDPADAVGGAPEIAVTLMLNGEIATDLLPHLAGPRR